MLDKKDKNWVVFLEEHGLIALVALELTELLGWNIISEKLLKAIVRKAHKADEDLLDTTELLEMVVYYICTGVRLYPVKYRKFKTKVAWLETTYNMVEKNLGDVDNYRYKITNMKKTARCYQLMQSIDKLLERDRQQYYRTELPEKVLRKYQYEPKDFRPFGVEW